MESRCMARGVPLRPLRADDRTASAARAAHVLRTRAAASLRPHAVEDEEGLTVRGRAPCPATATRGATPSSALLDALLNLLQCVGRQLLVLEQVQNEQAR